MSRRLVTMLGVLLITSLLAAPASAGDHQKLTYSGVYTAWAQTQKDFRFGAADYNDNYTVQMLRLNAEFHANDHVSAVTRVDMAQGWWGVDNADRTADRPGGRNGGSQLFDFKDTNFLIHFDQAYGKLKFPDQYLLFKVGRINYRLGHRMVLDNNLDGVQVHFRDKWHLSYAKMSEGVDGLTDNEITDGEGNVVTDGEDAHLFTLSFDNRVSDFAYNVYGMYYTDQSYDDGTSYLPNDLNYFRSRFAPNVTELMAFGLTGDYQNDGWTIKGEANYLTGSDDIANGSIDAIQLNDINNGDLSGWNVYVDIEKQLTEKFSIGGLLGMGSGDDDVTDGEGNVNKLRTSGFWYITEVWEDSIMPDEEGITPQGLGAPNVRGYRELENTTALQLNATYRPADKWKVRLSYTYLMATEDIPAWRVEEGETVVDYTMAESDIGSEFDYLITWNLLPSATVGVRGGLFMPGDGAGNLINGNNQHDDMAYETKGFLTVKF
jgi:hypothetical protein